MIRVTAGARLDVPSLKALLATPSDNALIVEAGNLRPNSGLRKLFETHKSAVALPCYSDEKSLLGLIDAELAEAGLSIDRETRDYLMTRLGADQALSRSEVVKLALYAQGGERIEPEDIEAIVGDAAETALDNFAYAVSGGDAEGGAVRTPAAGRRGHRQVGGAVGARPAFHAAAPRRRGARLGDSLEQAAKSLKPRLHFKREPIFIAHCKRWGANRLSHALPLIQEAVRSGLIAFPGAALQPFARAAAIGAWRMLAVLQ